MNASRNQGTCRGSNHLSAPPPPSHAAIVLRSLVHPPAEQDGYVAYRAACVLCRSSGQASPRNGLLCRDPTRQGMASAEDDPLVSSTRYGSVMSTPNINQLVEEAAGGNHAKFNRSASVGPGMTASNLNPQQRNRRALYVNLPFFRCVCFCIKCVCVRTTAAWWAFSLLLLRRELSFGRPCG